MKLTFIGDVMLGRFVREKFEKKAYDLVSDDLKKQIEESDYVVANLESPVTNVVESDSLKFAGNAELLDQFKWINCFSLSNNHINDFGYEGMRETISNLKASNFEYNGLFEDIYCPTIIESEGEKIAVITCADMMNYEFSAECPYKTLRVNRPDEIVSCIKEYKHKGFFVILYAHVGMLFSRYPNPVIRDFIHSMVDEGADCVVTAHPHCLGGSEYYKGKLIVYSIGDFLMDGSSFRRRRAGILNIRIEGGEIKEWHIVPVVTNNELSVCQPDESLYRKILNSFEYVSKKIARHSTEYKSFYKKQYRKELIAHSWSTILFESKRRGIKGMLRILAKRRGAVKEISKRVLTDRSGMSYDADAISENNISIEEIR
ncbi:MAG: CapA family protein [Bacteroidaceae bacterium]|nr:CapA family protein [Bacteroidaceae bacterium]